MRRYKVNKRRSLRSLRRGSSRTKAMNVMLNPQRGGWRL